MDESETNRRVLKLSSFDNALHDQKVNNKGHDSEQEKHKLAKVNTKSRKNKRRQK